MILPPWPPEELGILVCTTVPGFNFNKYATITFSGALRTRVHQPGSNKEAQAGM
jgi:predicted cupin superfamily sugar epimerase